MDDGGLQMLDDHMQDFPSTKLVVIDTLGQFKPLQHAYNVSVKALKTLNLFAYKYNLAIIATHHLYRGKPIQNDSQWRKQVQGSIGITASARTIIGLWKESDTDTHGGILVAGKDVPSQNIPLTFDEGALWNSTAPASDNSTEALQATVKAHPGVNAPMLAKLMGRPYDALRQQAHAAVHAGKLFRTNGTYWPSEASYEASLLAPDPQTSFASTQQTILST
jgi:hypothetical protein